MTVPGASPTDQDRLAAQVTDTGRRFGCTDRRVNGTLWWYSESSTLVALPTVELLRDGPALETVAADLRRTFESVITPLALVSGAGVPALWAIASDSVGNRALDAGAAAGSPAAGAELAVTLAEHIGAPLPIPRFVDVGARRFLRRSSCCLIYRTAAGSDATCVSCPHQRPEVRAARLAAL